MPFALPYGKAFSILTPVAQESVLRQMSFELIAITVDRPADAVDTQAAICGPVADAPRSVSAVDVQLPELAASAYATTSALEPPPPALVHHTNHRAFE